MDFSSCPELTHCVPIDSSVSGVKNVFTRLMRMAQRYLLDKDCQSGDSKPSPSRGSSARRRSSKASRTTSSITQSQVGQPGSKHRLRQLSFTCRESTEMWGRSQLQMPRVLSLRLFLKTRWMRVRSLPSDLLLQWVLRRRRGREESAIELFPGSHPFSSETITSSSSPYLCLWLFCTVFVLCKNQAILQGPSVFVICRFSAYYFSTVLSFRQQLQTVTKGYVFMTGWIYTASRPIWTQSVCLPRGTQSMMPETLYETGLWQFSQGLQYQLDLRLQFDFLGFTHACSCHSPFRKNVTLHKRRYFTHLPLRICRGSRFFTLTFWLTVGLS